MLCFDREYLDLLGSWPFGRCGRALWFCPLCRHILSLFRVVLGPSSGLVCGWYRRLYPRRVQARLVVLGLSAAIGAIGYRRALRGPLEELCH